MPRIPQTQMGALPTSVVKIFLLSVPSDSGMDGEAVYFDHIHSDRPQRPNLRPSAHGVHGNQQFVVVIFTTLRRGVGHCQLIGLRRIAHFRSSLSGKRRRRGHISGTLRDLRLLFPLCCGSGRVSYSCCRFFQGSPSVTFSGNDLEALHGHHNQPRVLTRNPRSLVRPSSNASTCPFALGLGGPQLWKCPPS